MNRKNLKQIFEGYIRKFDELNKTDIHEIYKWSICKAFPGMMDDVLAADPDTIPRKLYEVKKLTKNIIDSYTQPLMGMVEYSKDEPEAVRQMFNDLYVDDGGDLKIRMEKIADFHSRASNLLDRYYPGSHLYKQDSHSVSAYLFLYDPDHHYMYKANQCWGFADCIEFYDGWGMGDNIKLDVFYRMCDELVAEIKQDQELLAVDKSRFELEPDLHPDTEKHILAFDLIYCATVHNLYAKVSYIKRNTKEKNEYLKNKDKSKKLLEDYKRIRADYDRLREALDLFTDMVSAGDKVTHSSFGEGVIDSIDDRWLQATFDEGQKKVGLAVCLSKRLISVDVDGFEEMVNEYADVLGKADSLTRSLEYASKALEPYEEYLES